MPLPIPLKTDALTVRLLSDPRGVIDAPARPDPTIVIHVGQSVEIECRRNGQSHRGTARHGDVDIIPPGVPSFWDVKQSDTALVILVHSALLGSIAEEQGFDSRTIDIVNRFQMRDPQIEHIGWALKAAMESHPPSGGLYLDSLATALAVRLLECHSSVSPVRQDKLGMSGRKLRLVLSYIEDNLRCDLSLSTVASVAGLGISQFNKVFRESVGLPLHQYVIQRRVERAKMLLREEKLPLAQIAAEAGFAHQSHLARHVRRATGVSPKQLRENL